MKPTVNGLSLTTIPQSFLIHEISQLAVTMRYIQIPVSGEPDVMRVVEGQVPKPNATEVLIRVAAAGVSRGDVAQRQGKYPPPPDASPTLGLDVSGEIVGKGSAVAAFNIGDRVCALTNGGGYAEYCTAPATQCLPWPKGYDAIRAAALPENLFTVWANVFQQGGLGRNESLLVHGGSSGIGVVAIQLAHEFAGCVYATAGSQEKCLSCVAFGANAAINYREEDFESSIRTLTHGKGVDMILDMIGGPYFSRNINCLAANGRLIEIGTLQGTIVERFDLKQLIAKRLIVTGSTLRPRSTQEKGAIAAALKEKVWPVLEQGRCEPVIYKVFPLSEVNEAHRLMESSQHIGKIILKMTE